MLIAASFANHGNSMAVNLKTVGSKRRAIFSSRSSPIRFHVSCSFILLSQRILRSLTWIIHNHILPFREETITTSHTVNFFQKYSPFQELFAYVTFPFDVLLWLSLILYFELQTCCENKAVVVVQRRFPEVLLACPNNDAMHMTLSLRVSLVLLAKCCLNMPATQWYSKTPAFCLHQHLRFYAGYGCSQLLVCIKSKGTQCAFSKVSHYAFGNGLCSQNMQFGRFVIKFGTSLTYYCYSLII